MTTEMKDFPSDVTIHDSPSQFVAYSNVNGVSFTPEEAVMNFALRRQSDPTQADGVVKVYLSLPHAKRIMLVLAQLVEQYEQIFGEILLEPHQRLTDEGRKLLEKRQKENVSEPSESK